MSVRLSVRPSVRPERFPGICRRTHGGNGLKFYMLMCFDHLQNWLVYGRGLLIFQIFYASAFRRRRHYVFGLSVRPSGCPSVRSLKYPLLTCTWVRWSTRPTVTVLRHVRPSVRPSGEVSGHLPENAWREWPEILHADVFWPSSELISLWPWSVDFSNFGTILT